MGFFNDAKQWMFGGGATEGMQSGPKTADWQRTHLMTSTQQAAPTLGQFSTTQSDATRGQQNQLAGMLFNQAQGRAPGAGEMAVNRQIGQAQAQQTAQSMMARGAGFAGMAGKTAASNNMQLGVNGAGQAAIAQQGDQTMAQNNLQQLLGGLRQQDLAARGQDIAVGQGNQQAQLAQQGQNLQALAQMLGVDVATLQQDIAKRGMGMQDQGMFPTLLQVAGGIAGAAAGAK